MWKGKHKGKGKGDKGKDESGEAVIPRDDDDNEWIWKAISLGEMEFAKNGEAAFDFKGVHHNFGTPLFAFVHSFLGSGGAFKGCGNGGLSIGRLADQRKLVTALVEWLMHSGATASAVIPLTAKGVCMEFPRTDNGGVVQEQTQLRVLVGGKPTSSAILELREESHALAIKDPRWKNTAEHLEHLFAQIKKCMVPTTGASRSEVPDVVVDMWERIFQRGLAEGDVQIVAKDGQAVRAYAHVLEEASPVLKAMLCSSMLEGNPSSPACPRSIRVDESAEAVHTFVELVHIGAIMSEDKSGDTGAASSETPATGSVNNLLDVFRLCHRWQMVTIGELLELRLVRMVTSETIEAMLEVAVLQGATALKGACIEKAKDCESLLKKLKAGKLAPAVSGELRRVLGYAEPKPKRQRQSL